MRRFWTFLTSLLLAVLPAEGLGLVVNEEDACSSCRCCVQTNTNPAPVRSAPVKEARTYQAERQVPLETKVFAPPPADAVAPSLAGRDSHTSSPFRVPIFQRHCALLI